MSRRTRAVTLLSVAVLVGGVLAPGVAGAAPRAAEPYDQCNGELYSGAAHQRVWPANPADGQVFDADGYAVMDFSAEPAGVTVFFSPTNAGFYGTPAGMAVITGSDFDDTICGAAPGIQIIRGGRGNDVVIGEGGHDALFGNGGDDTIYLGTSPLDPVSELAPPMLRVNNFGSPFVEDSYASGGRGDDTIFGADGSVDELRGGPGDDYLSGGLGGNDFDDVQDGLRFNGQVMGDYLSGGAGDDVIYVTGPTTTVFGDGGNDTLVAATVAAPIGDADTRQAAVGGVWMFGESGDDVLLGSPFGDELFGGAGDDVIKGIGGGDFIYGNGGDDTLYAPLGQNGVPNGFADIGRVPAACSALMPGVWGGGGFDTIYGDTGNDCLYGGNKADTIYGGDGADNISGGRGGDTIKGGDGADVIHGDEGHDVIEPGLGGADPTDRAFGNGGEAYGDDGNDMLRCGLKGVPVAADVAADAAVDACGSSTLNGGDGDDTITGDPTGGFFNLILGGAGNDTIFTSVKRGDGVDGGKDDDTITVTGELWGHDFSVAGGSGDDTMYAFNPDVTTVDVARDAGCGVFGSMLVGGSGDDILWGGTGDDILWGGTGDDHLYGQGCTDLLDGGDDEDVLEGGDGPDEIFGGDGDDLLYGYTAASSADLDRDYLWGGGDEGAWGGDDQVDGLPDGGEDRFYSSCSENDEAWDAAGDGDLDRYFGFSAAALFLGDGTPGAGGFDVPNSSTCV